MATLEQEAAYWRRVAEIDNNKETILIEHAAKMAALLAQPWEVGAAVSRTWHVTYKRLDGVVTRATLAQYKFSRASFQLGYVRFQEQGELASGGAVDMIAAAVWLGLDEVEPGLVEWSISL
jgi:hypothetical protein